MDRLCDAPHRAPSASATWWPVPKTQKGTDLMTGAPGDVDAKQLRDVYVKSTHEPKS